MNNDRFCILPWIHLNVEPTGAVKPCCAYNPDQSWHDAMNLKNGSIKELWNSNKMQELRQSFINGEVPLGCQTCKQVDDMNIPAQVSYRQHMLNVFEHHRENTLSTTPEFKLVYWDFRFSNLCNFKCRMCNHSLSSSWYDDLSEDTKSVTTKFLNIDNFKNDLVNNIDNFIPIVEEIYFAGGEPLLMPEHYEILKKLIDHNRTDVRLRYNTNLSTLSYKNVDFIELWSKFDNVQLFISIDGVEENAEYTRHGTKWNNIEKNLQRVLSTDNLDYRIDVTGHILNAFHLPNFLDKLIQYNVKFENILFKTLLYPEHLRVSILPKHLKIRLEDCLLAHLNTINDAYKGKIKIIYDTIFWETKQESSEADFFQRKFYEFTNDLDISRNELISTSVPELTEWFNDLKIRYKDDY